MAVRVAAALGAFVLSIAPFSLGSDKIGSVSGPEKNKIVAFLRAVR